jgi:hypothetical protein
MKNISRQSVLLSLLLAAITLTGLVFSQSSNATATSIKVKVASMPACGSTEPTIALVKETAKELNLQIDFEYVPIRTIAHAKEHRHLGSPTIQINGLDIDPTARNVERFGIS